LRLSRLFNNERGGNKMATIKMIALITFRGQEGFITRGMEFEAKNEHRAAELVGHKLAKMAEGAAEGLNTVDLLEGIKTHAELDELINELELSDIPDKKTKLDLRKLAVEQALVNAK
jgi:hypothetical protein